MDGQLYFRNEFKFVIDLRLYCLMILYTTAGKTVTGGSNSV